MHNMVEIDLAALAPNALKTVANDQSGTQIGPLAQIFLSRLLSVHTGHSFFDFFSHFHAPLQCLIFIRRIDT